MIHHNLPFRDEAEPARVFTPLERIGQTVSWRQEITPIASRPEFQNRIEIRNNFKETEMHTSLFALIRGQLETPAEESA
jgi:hypothetical protein